MTYSLLSRRRRMLCLPSTDGETPCRPSHPTRSQQAPPGGRRQNYPPPHCQTPGCFWIIKTIISKNKCKNCQKSNKKSLTSIIKSKIGNRRIHDFQNYLIHQTNLPSVTTVTLSRQIEMGVEWYERNCHSEWVNVVLHHSQDCSNNIKIK